jgi:ABC-type phosphate transport system substrate-binding protein
MLSKHRIQSFVLSLALAATALDLGAAEGVVVIGHPGIKRLDAPTLARIYTGRVIEVDGVPVTAINANAGSDVRIRFLQLFLNQDEDKYVAYWTVRRYIGKGASPREMSKSSDVIRFVTSTPGAIGYIDASEVQPGLNVLLR